MSRLQTFQKEYNYLDAVQAEAKRAGVKWIEDLMKELKAKIPDFVKLLESEDQKLLPPPKV